MADQGEGGYKHSEFLADPEWLAGHLDDENLRVVDTDVGGGLPAGPHTGSGSDTR